MVQSQLLLVLQRLHLRELIYELFSYAGPFILVGMAIPLYQNVDQFTFNKAMASIGQGNISEAAFAAINLYGHKLVIIPVTLSTGISMTIIPVLTQSFTNQDFPNLKKQINQTLQIVFVLVVPAVVGLSVLSYEAYGSLYGLADIELTSYLLAWYAPVALLFALYAVSAIGSILTTMLAVFVAVIINLIRIKASIKYSYKQVFKQLLLVIIFSLIMLVSLLGFKYLINLFYDYQETRVGVTIALILSVGVGGLIYFILAYTSGLLEKALGAKIGFLDRFFDKFRRA